MYNRATSKQNDSQTANPSHRQRKIGQRSLRELALVNSQGDSYRQNKFGQVTDFMYKKNVKSFTFEYSETGALSAIASSDGWSWTRVSESSFDGWVVRNYFDSWTVSLADCQAVDVSPEGIQAVGKDPAQMGLPLRP